jgi:hypothetical protein
VAAVPAHCDRASRSEVETSCVLPSGAGCRRRLSDTRSSAKDHTRGLDGSGSLRSRAMLASAQRRGRPECVTGRFRRMIEIVGAVAGGPCRWRPAASALRFLFLMIDCTLRPMIDCTPRSMHLLNTAVAACSIHTLPSPSNSTHQSTRTRQQPRAHMHAQMHTEHLLSTSLREVAGSHRVD